jgi:hypothetical protein
MESRLAPSIKLKSECLDETSKLSFQQLNSFIQDMILKIQDKKININIALHNQTSEDLIETLQKELKQSFYSSLTATTLGYISNKKSAACKSKFKLHWFDLRCFYEMYFPDQLKDLYPFERSFLKEDVCLNQQHLYTYKNTCLRSIYSYQLSKHPIPQVSTANPVLRNTTNDTSNLNALSKPSKHVDNSEIKFIQYILHFSTFSLQQNTIETIFNDKVLILKYLNTLDKFCTGNKITKYYFCNDYTAKMKSFLRSEYYDFFDAILLLTLEKLKVLEIAYKKFDNKHVELTTINSKDTKNRFSGNRNCVTMLFHKIDLSATKQKFTSLSKTVQTHLMNTYLSNKEAFLNISM